jgi:hypothetical protein
LRECIYKRVAKEGKKPGFKSTQITFITSALYVSLFHFPPSEFRAKLTGLSFG